MISAMRRQRLLRISLSLAVNVLLSGTLLPLAMPPFGGYSPAQLGEVVLWQGIGTVGWPFALLGLAISVPFCARIASVVSLLPILVYPAMQALFIRAVILKTPRRGELVLLHLLVIVSFAVMWYYVRNGYHFMVG